MTGLISSHLMNGVMDRVKVQLLRAHSQIEFTCGSAVFSGNTLLKVLLRAGADNFAEKLCKLCSVLSLLKCILCESSSYLRISLAVCSGTSMPRIALMRGRDALKVLPSFGSPASQS